MTTISTAAELEALPVGSVWTDAYDNIGFRQEPGYLVPTGTWLDSLDKRSPTKWQTASEVIAETERYGALPLTVLYRPDRPVQPTVLPSVESVAKVLDIHRWQTMGVTSVQCECGEIIHGDSSLTAFPADQAFREHIAQAILALIVGRGEAEVKAEALTALPLDGLRQAEKVLRGIEHHWPADSVAETVALIDRAAAIRGEQ